MTYLFRTRVVSVDREIRKVDFRKDGDAWTYREVDLGFYLLLEGSQEKLFVGFDQPDMKKGDEVVVRISRE